MEKEMTMRKAAAWGLFALGALASTQTRTADYQAAASLERALPASTDTEIDGINWRCTGDKCVGTPVGRVASGSRMDECRKVAAALGRLSSFATRGKELSKRDLDTCNRVAR
jgi:hypothetical protein